MNKRLVDLNLHQFEDFVALQQDVLSASEAVEHRYNLQHIGAMTVSMSARDCRWSSFASNASASGMNVNEDRDLIKQAKALPTFDQGSNVPSGQYMEMVVEDVPLDLLSRRVKLTGGKDWPLLVLSLLRHEH